MEYCTGRDTKDRLSLAVGTKTRPTLVLKANTAKLEAEDSWLVLCFFGLGKFCYFSLLVCFLLKATWLPLQTWEGEGLFGLFIHITVHREGKSGQEAGGRNWSRNRERTWLTGSWSVPLSITLRIAFPGLVPLSVCWTLTNRFKKCSHTLACEPVWWSQSFFSVKVPTSDNLVSSCQKRGEKRNFTSTVLWALNPEYTGQPHTTELCLCSQWLTSYLESQILLN